MAGQGKIGVANGIMGLYDARGEVTFNGEKLILTLQQNHCQRDYFCIRG